MRLYLSIMHKIINFNLVNKTCRKLSKFFNSEIIRCLLTRRSKVYLKSPFRTKANNDWVNITSDELFLR